MRQAYIRVVEIYEAKSRGGKVSRSQSLRLKRSAEFCSHLFDLPTRIYLAQPQSGSKKS